MVVQLMGSPVFAASRGIKRVAGTRCAVFVGLSLPVGL